MSEVEESVVQKGARVGFEVVSKRQGTSGDGVREFGREIGANQQGTLRRSLTDFYGSDDKENRLRSKIFSGGNGDAKNRNGKDRRHCFKDKRCSVRDSYYGRSRRY